MASKASARDFSHSYNRRYDLDGDRKKVIDENSGEAKANPWHQHCKAYAAENGVSYAAAISMAGESWKNKKEELGLSFRKRPQKKEKSAPVEDNQMVGKPLPMPPKPIPARKPRKPKETRKRESVKVKISGKRMREEPQQGWSDEEEEHYVSEKRQYYEDEADNRNHHPGPRRNGGGGGGGDRNPKYFVKREKEYEYDNRPAPSQRYVRESGGRESRDLPPKKYRKREEYVQDNCEYSD